MSVLLPCPCINWCEFKNNAVENGYICRERKANRMKSGLILKLEEAIKTAESRETVYGKGHAGHNAHGAALAALFPEGLTLKTPEEFTRFILFALCTMKMARYAKNFTEGGHKDSAHDAGVYSFILEDYDDASKS